MGSYSFAIITFLVAVAINLWHRRVYWPHYRDLGWFCFYHVGILVSATIIGLIVGIPLIAIGVLLVFRGLF